MERWQIIQASGHTTDCADYAAYRFASNLAEIEYPSRDATLGGIEWLRSGIVDCSCTTVSSDDN